MMRRYILDVTVAGSEEDRLLQVLGDVLAGRRLHVMRTADLPDPDPTVRVGSLLGMLGMHHPGCRCGAPAAAQEPAKADQEPKPSEDPNHG